MENPSIDKKNDVLFYSFSSSTRRVAKILARRLGAPAAEVKTKEPIRHPAE